jgi:hypothetical protein
VELRTVVERIAGGDDAIAGRVDDGADLDVVG